MYLGYSVQNYEFERHVSLPASKKHAALHERLDGHTDGHALAVSIELIRPIQWRPDLRLLPLAAVDYEKAWIDGYQESNGLTALIYDSAEMERLTLRAGLEAEYNWHDKAALKARAQYGFHLVGGQYPEIGVRFAGSTLPNQRWADIRGVDTGRHYLNLGLGANIKVGDRENSLIYLNYDAKLNSRTVIHATEGGLELRF
jgi:uncharacterized protein with beta-barrel porin domain